MVRSREAQSPRLTTLGPYALLMGGSTELSGADRANKTLFWHAELGRAISASEAADGYVKFVQGRYIDSLGQEVASGMSTAEPKAKRVKTETAGKGKGKARADAMEEDDVEVEGPADATENEEAPGDE